MCHSSTQNPPIASHVLQNESYSACLQFYLSSAYFSDFISYLFSSGQTHPDLIHLCICCVLWRSLPSLSLTSSDISPSYLLSEALCDHPVQFQSTISYPLSLLYNYFLAFITSQHTMQFSCLILSVVSLPTRMQLCKDHVLLNHHYLKQRLHSSPSDI